MQPIPCPVSSEKLRHLVQVEKLTDKEIASRLSGGTIRRVQSWRKRYGIDAIPRWARNEVTPIEGKLQSLLVGSMLGDGRLVRRTHATHYEEGHCKAQVGYLKWKADIWGTWVQALGDSPSRPGYYYVSMRTYAHADLNPWQEMFYEAHDKGWKRLLPEVVDLVDEFALAIWYLDDGTAGWWPSIIFGADDASREVAWAIFEKFGLHPRWEVKKGKTGEFHMEREDTAERFIEIITPHVPKCMISKLDPFGFQGPGYQTRKRVTPELLQDGVAKGIPLQQMACELGVGSSTIRRRLREWAIPYEAQQGRPAEKKVWLAQQHEPIRVHPRIGCEDAGKYRALSEGGLPDQEIATLFGVSPDTVRRRLRDLGVPPRKTGPKGKITPEAAHVALKDTPVKAWNDLPEDEQSLMLEQVYQVLRKTTFPYPQPVVDPQAEFSKLKAVDLTIKDPLVIPSRSYAGLKLCYPFFPNRYTARSGKVMSAFEAWHDEGALRRAILWQLRVGHPVVPHRVLRAVTANCRTPSIFKPVVARFIYEQFCPPGGTVWDPCAGYGGRLLGALAAGVGYWGTDVEGATVGGNRELAGLLGCGDRVQLFEGKAQEYKPDVLVDLVFTSPPYFDQERYSEGAGQSWVEFSTLGEWVEGFLRPLVQRSWEALKPGGRLVLNVADVKGHALVESTFKVAVEVGFTLVEEWRMPLMALNRKNPWEPVLVFKKG